MARVKQTRGKKRVRKNIAKGVEFLNEIERDII